MVCQVCDKRCGRRRRCWFCQLLCCAACIRVLHRPGESKPRLRCRLCAAQGLSEAR